MLLHTIGSANDSGGSASANYRPSTGARARRRVAPAPGRGGSRGRLRKAQFLACRKNAKPGTSVLLTTATNTSPTLTPWSHGSAVPIACHCLLTTASVDSPDHASGQPQCQLNPKFVRESHDPQIEKAIDVVMGQLKKTPVNYARRPSART